MAQRQPRDARPLGAAVPAFILPARFEDFEGFRETTLAAITDKLTNATLRTLGQVVYDLVLECGHLWPKPKGGAYFQQCQAVLGDLRHLEGWFAHLDSQRTDAALAPEEEKVSVACGGFRLALQAIGDQLARDLGPRVIGNSGTETGSIRVPLPDIEEIAAILSPQPWAESANFARQWIIFRGLRGEGEGTGALLHQLRSRANAEGAFSSYHVLALELLSMLRERGGDAPLRNLGVSDLAAHLLKAAGIPEDVAKHYAEHLL